VSDDLDRDSWERRWTRVLDADPTGVDRRPPNAHLLAEVADLPAGLALDAGAGHGSEALWLAARGWRVTAVDFAATALARGAGRAQREGADVADRIAWIEGDLGSWTPPAAHFDLVTCLYVHVAGSVPEMVRRLASGVAPGGTLLLVGRPTAAGQAQVSVPDALEVLDTRRWEILVADDRRRGARGAGTDAVVRARRRT
jgi:2-polyprenyl-3-methyl-5-hydroxy-6-metoxy-1,4-benzoquinol methylase